MKIETMLRHTASLIRAAREGIWEGLVWSAAIWVVFVIELPGFYRQYPQEFPVGFTFGTALYIVGRLYIYLKYGK